MRITAKNRTYWSTIIVESENTTIKEDVRVGDESNEMIEQFITLANDLSRLNEISDINFVKNIFEAFLNDSEKEQLIELITLKP